MENSNENTTSVADQPPSPQQPHGQESTRDEGLHTRVDDTRDEEEPEQQWDEDYDEDDQNPPDYEGDYTYADEDSPYEDSAETPEPQWLQPQSQPQQQRNLAQRRQQQPVRVQQDDMQPAQTDGGDKRNPLKLRLDLNLAVDIELKARIHGDLTLALLEGL